MCLFSVQGPTLVMVRSRGRYSSRVSRDGLLAAPVLPL